MLPGGGTENNEKSDTHFFEREWKCTWILILERAEKIRGRMCARNVHDWHTHTRTHTHARLVTHDLFSYILQYLCPAHRSWEVNRRRAFATLGTREIPFDRPTVPRILGYINERSDPLSLSRRTTSSVSLRDGDCFLLLCKLPGRAVICAGPATLNLGEP